MRLYKGLLFHLRYQLEASLGCGASAEVWLARDTKANNLRVALKIFSRHSQMDSYGLQNFEREFTTVYNLKHSNLLPPTGYDICEGRPYLIMQYCENGSCNGLAGRMDEDDIIKFLHDVAAGLECLHRHNLIHQDIKPDNILIDDNCNYVVTDFGISINSGNDFSDSNGMSGGTRDYMGPERFDGETVPASDMWSLGATAVELLTGDTPYGQHGGLLQAEGEPLPDLPKLQPEVRGMILSCLEKDPSKRISAEEIRRKTELYLETGSWTRKTNKNTIIMIVAGIAGVLLCAGIWIWDYNRTKIGYFKDYTEYWGVPKGIGKLSESEMRHRVQSYRFEKSRGKLRRMSLVNSRGKVIPHSDSEHMTARFPDVRYFYTDGGKIDYKTIYDQNGRLLFKMDYDENLKTATFRQNDEYGTEMNLDVNTNTLYKQAPSPFDEKSRISRYLLAYDDNGLLTERRYVGLQNVPACDKDRIYGQRFVYDDKGRRIEEQFIGPSGDITSNSDGLAIKVFTYDDNDNWTTVTYLDSERQGSHDGGNCSLVRLEYDEYGNRIKECYFTLDGTPSIRKDTSCSGQSYTIDGNGFRQKFSLIDTEGNPAYYRQGFSSYVDSCDANGFVAKRTYLDENDKPVLIKDDNGEVYSSLMMKNSPTGQILELAYYDLAGDPIETSDGFFVMRNTYDSIGNLLEQRYLDKNGKPALAKGFLSSIRWEYDSFNREVKEAYFDAGGKPATNDGKIHEYRLEYNRQGSLTKMTLHDTRGRLTSGDYAFAGYDREYDELGNLKSIQYFNASGKPSTTTWGYARIEYGYDPATNFLVRSRFTDVNGRETGDDRWKYDRKGNVVMSYTLVNGRLKPATRVLNKEYDSNNRAVSEWYSDLSGKMVNGEGVSYAKAKYEYDGRGNLVQTTYWKADGNPGIDEQKAHKRENRYDAMNRIVVEKNYDAKGKPLTGSDVNPEGHVKYDQWGNMEEVACFDGYGKPRLSSDGFFKMVRKFDRRGNVVHEEYVGLKGEPVCSRNNQYAKADHKYDSHGNKTESRFFDIASGCIRIESWKYNPQNNVTEQRICDGSGRLSDKFYGVSRMAIEYDASGIIPKIMRLYNMRGSLLATRTWNASKGEWNPLQIR